MLATDHFTLRGLNESDQSKLAELCNNKKTWNNVWDLFPSPYTEENAVIKNGQICHECGYAKQKTH